ncbi:WD40 repeat-like protein [Cucurbitaria berberidis CBS 394.84]|uniref:WD40 repeat-like protein n=1 Tax=Cucurbitaria berberidis CBS 394.84 TaxID=1168544 RepID=A0A9P4GDR8_9PLEO|nr:WD40 repeat-like protein [Cucurbitaria berberidis CBS 394.84]KAF1843461.1 WD40 repeat-like protein [Cucurbitaria berberidis CBS 394.84]
MGSSQWELPSLRGTVILGVHTWAKQSLTSSSQCFDVKFYPYTLPGVDPVFAVCGGSFLIIYRCVLEKDSTIEILRWFESADENAPEGEPLSYNSVVWTQAENGDPLVCVTGNPQINVFNVKTGVLEATLIGHGDKINDLAVSPIDPTIMASCSIDHSVRLWSLQPTHKERPLAAICHGQGHKDQAYHRKGRYILSAGMDTRINLWVVPDDLKEHAGTDKPAMVHYPHFSTTEIHTDFVDCVQWYNDLILSHACREDKIIMWAIDGFNSDRSVIPPAPIPTSSAVNSRTPVTIPANSTSNTRSAWPGRFQRLMQFDLPHTINFYNRFSIFHELGHHPILAVGNDKSKVHFWDLQRLEASSPGQDGYPPEGAKGLSRYSREESLISNASSAISAGSTKSKQKKSKKPPRETGISDPFRSIHAHKIIEIPKYKAFPFRQFSWSRDGQWCVGVGDRGFMTVFHRWEQGVPPPETDAEVDLPIRPRPQEIS